MQAVRICREHQVKVDTPEFIPDLDKEMSYCASCAGMIELHKTTIVYEPYTQEEYYYHMSAQTYHAIAFE